MKNLSNFEVVEMNHEEMIATDGGCLGFFIGAALLGFCLALFKKQ